MAMGEIRNGAYSLTQSDGPNPGDNGIVVMGRQAAAGKNEWQWSSPKSVKVDESGYSGDFAVEKSATKPAPQPTDDGET
jgi:hypothetical protein